MATEFEAWIGALAALLTAVVGLFKYFNYRTKRDRMAAVGSSFAATVEALASDNATQQLAAAILLRRFFSPTTEQGEVGTPYRTEAVRVIAGLLRETRNDQLQKVLADGLRDAKDLVDADLQHCCLDDAFLGRRRQTVNGSGHARDGEYATIGGRFRARFAHPWRTASGQEERALDLSRADLFRATLRRASLRGVIANRTVFYEAKMERCVLDEADLRGADFRDAVLTRASFVDADVRDADFRGATLTDSDFSGAKIGGAKFDDVIDGPGNVTARHDADRAADNGGVIGV